VITWQRSGERRTWVAEAPGGLTLTVSKGFGSPRWQPAIIGAEGQTRWTGDPCRTREAACRAAEAEARRS
jgi:hypothetical protein